MTGIRSSMRAMSGRNVRARARPCWAVAAVRTSKPSSASNSARAPREPELPSTSKTRAVEREGGLPTGREDLGPCGSRRSEAIGSMPHRICNRRAFSCWRRQAPQLTRRRGCRSADFALGVGGSATVAHSARSLVGWLGCAGWREGQWRARGSREVGGRTTPRSDLESAGLCGVMPSVAMGLLGVQTISSIRISWFRGSGCARRAAALDRRRRLAPPSRSRARRQAPSRWRSGT